MSRRTFQPVAVILSLFLLAFSGCATNPIKKEYREEALNVPFSTVLQNPTAYKGSTVVWGGEIIKTINIQSGTDLIVLQIPTASDGRPEEATESKGRFLAKSSRFLDPSIYKQGRKITVAGKLTGTEQRQLGQIQYTYPVVQIEQLHLWKKEQPPPPAYWDYWGWYGPWGFYGPYGPPYWWP